MDRIKFNDWQDMALKKDTETIIKSINSHEPVFFSLCIEIIVAVGAVIIDHFFDKEAVNPWIWIIATIIAVIVPLYMVILKLVKWISAIKRVKKGKLGVRQFVDLYDNQICYYVMTSNSYGHLLTNNTTIRDDEKVFIYQEGSYYNNKAIQELYKMKPVISKVFTPDVSESIDARLIAVYRLTSLINVMKCNRIILDNCVKDLDSEKIKTIRKQCEINGLFFEMLEDFIKDLDVSSD